MSTALIVIPMKDNRIDMRYGKYGEFLCKYCDKEFGSSMDGIVELTFHTLIRHADEINND